MVYAYLRKTYLPFVLIRNPSVIGPGVHGVQVWLVHGYRSASRRDSKRRVLPTPNKRGSPSFYQIEDRKVDTDYYYSTTILQTVCTACVGLQFRLNYYSHFSFIYVLLYIPRVDQIHPPWHVLHALLLIHSIHVRAIADSAWSSTPLPPPSKVRSMQSKQ